MQRTVWVKDQIVPAMLAHGSFGNRGKHSLKITVHKGIDVDHFTSTIFFINLELKFEHQTLKVYHMLLKISREDLIYRSMYMRMFSSITRLSCTRKSFKQQAISLGQILPKCNYAKCGAGDTNIDVLANMAPRGFRPSADRLSLDYDHCAMSLRHLARYHAISYAMKKLEASAFHAMVNKFRAQNFANASPEDTSYFLKKTSYRGIRYVEDRQELGQVTLDRLKSRLGDAGQLFLDSTAPKEPLAVTSH
jgi:hypothetical protein